MENRLTVSDWLSDPQLQRLFKLLGTIGEVRFVGGAVRDALLGQPHNDIDLATTARPETVMKEARKAKFKIVPTGIAHGTVTAILKRGPVEITTLRRDVATDGRHATIAYTDNWQEDAARRDFTINALSCDGAGVVFDYFGGLADLEAGKVRFIGTAAERIAEDYLRILRFFRFTARYGRGAPDAEGLAAITKLAPGMVQLSGERIQAEVFRMLVGPRVVEMWRLMLETGVVGAILGGATDIRRLARVIQIEEEHKLDDPMRRLIAVTTMPVMHEIADRLKLSNAHRARLDAIHDDYRLSLVRNFHYGPALYKAGEQSVIDLAILDSAADDEVEIDRLMEFLKTWKQPKFPLGGEALMDIGLKPGPIFGELLALVEQWWMENDFSPTKQECFAELKRIWGIRRK